MDLRRTAVHCYTAIIIIIMTLQVDMWLELIQAGALFTEAENGRFRQQARLGRVGITIDMIFE